MRSLNCPECSVPMQAFLAEAKPTGTRVELDRCSQCTRVWFDVKELEHAVGMTFLPRLKGSPSTRACPACGGTLRSSLIRGDVTIEECDACSGALLERPDFEVIGGSPLREVKPSAAAPAAPAVEDLLHTLLGNLFR